MQHEKIHTNTTDTRWDLVRAKLEMAKPCLIKAGSVIKKTASSSREHWAVRYREHDGEKVVQRSIYLGDAKMADRSKKLIDEWRDEALTPQDRRKNTLLDMANVLATARGYSARARSRLRAAAEDAAQDPRKALYFTLRVRDDDAAFRFGKRPGRPSQSGLW